MADIVQFPVKPEREWLKIEPKINKAIDQYYSDPAIAESLKTSIKETFLEKYNQFDWTFKVDLPCPPGITQAEIDAMYKAINAATHDLIRQLNKPIGQLIAENAILKTRLLLFEKNIKK